MKLKERMCFLVVSLFAEVVSATHQITSECILQWASGVTCGEAGQDGENSRPMKKKKLMKKKTKRRAFRKH
ncbi:butyrophilin subfamily 2 member A2-like isoform X1 [Lates japonicus]|uniref:Butyrophilin subfamily 2 member A2-like isoform X1 n=1 Tax=Lates japonicus TaxID=270547 RepID=A0AAD3NGJ6_LATJO|nr:butyrophilin subfamily 2 member A2-like isoform X1 [Lates japonicus]